MCVLLLRPLQINDCIPSFYASTKEAKEQRTLLRQIAFLCHSKKSALLFRGTFFFLQKKVLYSTAVSYRFISL